MYLTLRKDWEVFNAARIEYSDGKILAFRKIQTTIIRAGRHECELIPHPLGHSEPWIVLKGTKIGQPASAWRFWDDPMYGDFQITIEE